MAHLLSSGKKTEKPANNNAVIVVASGKRKSAIARAFVRPGKGRVRVNSMPLEIVEPKIVRNKIMEALLLSGPLANQVDVDVKTRGGGTIGQADAARLAVASGLVKMTKEDNENLKKTYMEYDRSLLVADPRRKETRKPGRSKARAAAQKSKR